MSNSLFTMSFGEERPAKKRLAIDPAHTLNVYTADLGLYLGWAYYPWAFSEDNYLHGVMLHYGSLPGGPISNYNQGKTLTHEVGHYLGLYHTFQGGCGDGDLCADTPAEESPARGCPIGRDSCPAPGVDPIHNYMDYSYDACLFEFTSDQTARMRWAAETYRPSI